jgi:hypothetical protein
MDPSEVTVTLSPALRSMPVSVHCLSAGIVRLCESAEVVVVVVTVVGATGAFAGAAGVGDGGAAGVAGAGVVSTGAGVVDWGGGAVCDFGWNPGAGASCARAEAEQSSVRSKRNRRFMAKHSRCANDSTTALRLNTASTRNPMTHVVATLPSNLDYVCSTPTLNLGTSGLCRAALRAQVMASRVSMGSMILSTHKRAAP